MVVINSHPNTDFLVINNLIPDLLCFGLTEMGDGEMGGGWMDWIDCVPSGQIQICIGRL